MSKLVNGLIPKGTECPWWKECALINTNCPVPSRTKDVDFSCGCARAFNMTIIYKGD